MGEGQVSIDGRTLRLPELFFVIATQNPIEFRGTYPLPEAQLDRFAIQFDMGYVSVDEEIEILNSQANSRPIDSLEAVCDLEDVRLLKAAVKRVRLSEEIKRYVVEIVRATRDRNGVELGASPRASLTLSRVAQAAALFDGLEFVTPDHVQKVATATIAHRLVVEAQAGYSGMNPASVVEAAIESVRAPV